MPSDLFDILDVSLREDTYSRLIVEVLRQSREIAAGVFKALTGKTATGEIVVLFREGLGEAPYRNHPDILIKCPTSDGPWWLVIEAKVQAGEGKDQTFRYWTECEKKAQEGECVGYSLYFLTLDGEPPNDSHWYPLTHGRLAGLVSNHDSNGLLTSDAVVAMPWQAYAARLRHLESLAPPGDDEPLLSWLTQPTEYFVTRRQRAAMVGQVIVPRTYDVRSSLYVARIHDQLLVIAWLPYWKTGVWDETGPLENCIFVHFELNVKVPLSGPYATCHLHCEANPYMSKKQNKALGKKAERFNLFMNCLQGELHSELSGTNWKAARRHLQKAYIRCPMSKATTSKELREFLLPKMDAVRDRISQAMIAAAKECGLDWWRKIEADMAGE